MVSKARAFAPANISCIFKIYVHKNPRWMGSYGVGFTLDEGIAAEASKSKITEISFNNKKIEFPAVKSVIKKLTNEKIKIELKSKLPLGCGFGLSGASALAVAFAVNKLLNLKKSKKELGIIAHTADVENKTGLGDVVNQYYGGFFAKLKPSSHFAVERIPIASKEVYCKYFGKISTKSIITSPKLVRDINTAADISLKKIKALLGNKNKKEIKFADIINISKEFAVNSGLLNDKLTIKTINKIGKNGGNVSMIMLGNAVFSDKPFRGSIKLKISNKGAY